MGAQAVGKVGHRLKLGCFEIEHQDFWWFYVQISQFAATNQDQLIQIGDWCERHVGLDYALWKIVRSVDPCLLLSNSLFIILKHIQIIHLNVTQNLLFLQYFLIRFRKLNKLKVCISTSFFGLIFDFCVFNSQNFIFKHLDPVLQPGLINDKTFYDLTLSKFLKLIKFFYEWVNLAKLLIKDLVDART